MTKAELQTALGAAGLTSWTARKVHLLLSDKPQFVADDPAREWTVWHALDNWVADYTPRQAAGMSWTGRGDNIKSAMRRALQQSTEGAERIAAAVAAAHERAQEYLS